MANWPVERTLQSADERRRNEGRALNEKARCFVEPWLRRECATLYAFGGTRSVLAHCDAGCVGDSRLRRAGEIACRPRPGTPPCHDRGSRCGLRVSGKSVCWLSMTGETLYIDGEYHVLG